MPVHQVKGGYKWGKSGKVYATKTKAAKQGAAIQIRQHVDALKIRKP